MRTVRLYGCNNGLFIHSFLNEYLGCFQVLAIPNKSLCGHVHSYLLTKCLMVVERLEQSRCLLTFKEAAKVFPVVLVLFHISTSTVRGCSCTLLSPILAKASLFNCSHSNRLVVVPRSDSALRFPNDR